jgi:hypothetical protein
VILMLILFAAQGAAAVRYVETSARCVDVAEPPSARVAPLRLIAPGPPPLLSFRYYEGRVRHRYGNLDLVLDDAGH